jgi:hypothetical protein
VVVDFATGAMRMDDTIFQAEPFSQVQMDIYQAGDLFKYGQKFQAQSQKS